MIDSYCNAGYYNRFNGNPYYNSGYYNRFGGDSYYGMGISGDLFDDSSIKPITIPEKKDNSGKIAVGGTVIAGTIAALLLAKKGKISGAKKAVTDLYTKAKTNVKDLIKKDTITKYTDGAKKYFSEKGQKVWNPIKNAYQHIKGFFKKGVTPKTDTMASMPKFNAYEYEVGKFNPYV